ncbi:MAG: prepilin-type N-terminal cleavage/methylation domain-containing protein [Lachnospiraceae bacterium]|nr:prepilin-type N-terminal cleavage/methylation domain-containing protein [Lachnospiraceae bacterium]
MRRRQLIGKSLKLNNAGVSLVELIVAILILAIIAVPVMRLFTTAARTNKVNAEKVNADIVAENLLEILKAKGMKGFAYEVYDCEKSGAGAGGYRTFCGLLPVKSVTGGEATITNIILNPLSYDFVENADHRYVYTINGILEGDKEFDATITFKAQNTVNTATEYYRAGFDKDNTIFLDPLAHDEFSDEKAIQSFVKANRTKVLQDYNDALVNLLIHNENFPDDPWDPATLHYDSYEDPANIISNIDREVVITIDDTDDNTGYIINSYIKYKLEKVGVVDPLDEEYISPICDNVEILKPKAGDPLNLLLFYVPYGYLAQAAFKEDIYNQVKDLGDGTVEPYLKTKGLLKNVTGIDLRENFQNVTFKNNSTTALPDIYIVAQGKVDTFLNNLLVYASVGNFGTFYSNVDIGIEYTDSLIKVKNLNVNKERLLDVEIIVKDHDTGEEMRKLTSSIVRNKDN